MNNDKSIQRTTEILKQRYQPELYAKEQEEKQKKLAETLAFIDGVLAAYELEKSRKDSEILFVTDPTHPKGFRPSK
ncbi:hypothetical protein A7D27_06395 [Pseudomonas sp. 1D4]|uniref:hypothetical protein n=1 Tax=Pseudomonadaceae TaxID=135621 RepID=UPI00084BA0B8|nr:MULTISPECIES: hypothetical protein [Pseudomonas]OEC44947.1 hypothetical protein A7D27_06395 [Pseudomonas sp. 1D4]